MASLSQRSNGTFYADFYDANRDPARKRLSLRTKNKSTARAKIVRWERAYELGEADPWTDDMDALLRPNGPTGSTPLEEAKEQFLQSRREMNCTAETLRTYRETVGYLVGQIGPEKPLARLTMAQMKPYIYAPDVSPATQNKRFRMLRAFLNWAVEEGLIKESPLCGKTPPKVERDMTPVAIRIDELKAICNEIKDEYRRLRKKNQIPAGRMLWRISAFYFSYLTGARRSEIARLRWKDVDLESRSITLRNQKSRKTTRHPINDKAASILRRIDRGSPNDYVFRSPYSTKRTRNVKSWGNRMTRTFAKYRDKTDVRSELSFHALRRGHLSELARNGASAHVIRKAARHSDLSTALHYVSMHSDDIRGHLDAAF